MELCRLLFFDVELTFLGFWFVEQAAYGLLSLEAPASLGMDGGVAYWAHAGGFVFGAILGWMLGLFDKAEDELKSVG